MWDMLFAFLVMRAMDFVSFDITVVFASRKREGGFWFPQIWTHNKNFVAKEAKESKERGN